MNRPGFPGEWGTTKVSTKAGAIHESSERHAAADSSTNTAEPPDQPRHSCGHPQAAPELGYSEDEIKVGAAAWIKANRATVDGRLERAHG